jgi:hypothetical protein
MGSLEKEDWKDEKARDDDLSCNEPVLNIYLC